MQENGGFTMSEVYHEFMIKRRMTVVGVMLRILSVLLCVAVLLLFSQIGFIALIIEIALAYGVRYVFQNTNLEYEYCYLSGECQIDKICGRMKRKGCGKIEMEKVEIMAIEGSKILEEYENKDYKLRDFSSLEKDARKYVAFQRKDGNLIKIIFEPNDDILEAMEMAAPRKVIIEKEK